MAPRRHCPTCGSRQWHKEPSSGLIACSEGHVLQNYRNETTEAEEVGRHALKKRALKSGRKKRSGRNQANPKLYHGARGRYHYFECQQLLLRKQVVTLMRLWSLPPEFEILCRDVWALHLSLLPDPPPAEPYYHAQSLRNDTVIEDPNISDGGNNEAGGGDASNEESDTGSTGSGGQSDTDEEADDVDGGAEEDPELLALLRENSETDELSSSEDDQDANNSKKNEGKRSHPIGVGRRKRRRCIYESPASTIAVLVVACWMMRIPALYRDFSQLIKVYELPYLDPVARHLLPESMIAHLTKHDIQALSPFYAPSTRVLHGLSSRLSKLMYTSYRVFTPEANVGPILWRVVSQGLAGTPILYRLTKRLAQALSLPLTIYHTLAPGLTKCNVYDPSRHTYDNVPPEVGLISVGIVVLKMIYGLDGRPRTPQDADDVACGLPRLDEYLGELNRLDEEEEESNRRGLFDSRRDDVCMGELSDKMIDEYLEFSKRALIGKGKAKSIDGLLERYFPLTYGEDESLAEATAEGEVRKPLQAVIADERSELRPGEGYRIYRSQDVCGTMTEEYSKVIERAGRWVGVSIEYLSGVIETYERRVVRWEKRRRSRE